MPPRRDRRRPQPAAAAARQRPSVELKRLQDALPKLSAVAGRQLGLPTAQHGGPQTVAEVLLALTSVINAIDSWNAQDWQNFAADRRLQVALLQLAAVAVHCPVEHLLAAFQPGGGSARTTARGEILAGFAAVDIICAVAVEKEDANARLAALGLCEALLRMELLHAGARQLAAATAAIRSSGRALPGHADAALKPIKGMLGLVQALVTTAMQREPAGAAVERLPPLRTLLTSALAGSCVLEHAAQALVALAAWQGPGPSPASLRCAVRLLCGVFDIPSTIVQDPSDDDDDKEEEDEDNDSDGTRMEGSTSSRSSDAHPSLHQAARSLLTALHTPCAVHVLLGVAITALHDADGGPTHGLDPQLWQRLRQAEPSSGTGEVPGLHLTLLQLYPLLDTSNEEGRLPLRKHPACELLLRVVRLAVGAMEAHQQRRGGRQQQQSAGGRRRAGGPTHAQQQRPGRAVLEYEDAEFLVHGTLVALSEVLRERPTCETREEQWREAWSLLLRFADCVLAREDITSVNSHAAPLLSCYVDAALGREEDQEPGPAMAPGLALGLLPFLERLLRRAGEDTAGPHAALITGVLFDELRWLPLLSPGPPQQGAAVVVTLRKLLQCVAGRRVAAPRERLSDDVWFNLTSTVPDLLLDLAHHAEEAPQLPLHLAFALHQLLPALVRLLLVVEAEVAQLEGGAGLQPDEWTTWLRGWQVVSYCLPALLSRRGQPHPHALEGGAAAGGGCLGQAGGAGAGEGGAAGPGEGGAAGAEEGGAAGAGEEGAAGAGERGAGSAGEEEAGSEGRQLVLGVGPVQVVGAALRTLHRVRTAGQPLHDDDISQDEVCHLLHTVVLTACCVAAAFPDELRAALAAAGVGGGGGGGGGDGGAAAGDSCTTGGCVVRDGSAVVWPVRALLPYLYGPHSAACALLAEELAQHLDAGAAGPYTLLRCRPFAEELLGASLIPIVAITLPPAREALALLRTCSNPACAVLRGDSEADVQLQACASCGAAWYCCRECQAAHERAGHKGCAPAGQRIDVR